MVVVPVSRQLLVRIPMPVLVLVLVLVHHRYRRRCMPMLLHPSTALVQACRRCMLQHAPSITLLMPKPGVAAAQIGTEHALQVREHHQRQQ